MMKRRWIAALMVACIAFIFVSCGNGNSAYDYDKGYEPKETEDNTSVVKSDYAGGKTAQEQKRIKSCSIYAETKDYDGALLALNAAITEAGGYVESQNAYGNSYNYSGNRRSSMTIRIPVEALDSFTDQLNGLLNVTSISSSIVDVTEAYYDAEAKLQTLKTEHATLLTMMESLNKAEEYAFWTELFKQLSVLEQDIASLEATIRNYDNKVSYSTVQVEIVEVKELTDKEEKSFGKRIGEAFSTSWEDFGTGWCDFVVWFVGAFPTLLVLAVIFGGGFCAIYFPIRHSKKKKQEK